jgi:hypothetical protein
MEQSITIIFSTIIGTIVGFIILQKWPQKGKTGVNFETVICPECQKEQPFYRLPSSLKQTLWGGYTCECGCEIDKYGNIID